MVSVKKLCKFDGDPLLAPTICYKLISGALQDHTLTRPVIFFLSYLVIYIFVPSLTKAKDFSVAKCMLRYLKGTIMDFDLWFSVGTSQLDVCCDSDWVRDPINQHSTGAMVFF